LKNKELGENNSDTNFAYRNKAKTLEESVGKTFSLKTQIIAHDTKGNLDFATNWDYVFGSLVETKEQKPPGKNNLPTETENDNSNPLPSTWPKVLIMGGIIVILVLIIIILIKLLINKFSIQKIFN